MSSDLRLAEHFPRSKGCEKQAQTFFECFTVNGQQGISDDVNLALTECKQEMSAYDSCMKFALQKYPAKVSRAGAAYRRRES
jgi:hypothetical protein